MKRWIPAFAVLAAIGLLSASKVDVASAADNKYTIALIPGLTTDAFYITMRKGAEAAAKDLGATLEPGDPGSGAECDYWQKAFCHFDRSD